MQAAPEGAEAVLFACQKETLGVSRSKEIRSLGASRRRRRRETWAKEDIKNGVPIPRGDKASPFFD